MAFHVTKNKRFLLKVHKARYNQVSSNSDLFPASLPLTLSIPVILPYLLAHLRVRQACSHFSMFGLDFPFAWNILSDIFVANSLTSFESSLK